jgi:hypothetical protein
MALSEALCRSILSVGLSGSKNGVWCVVEAFRAIPRLLRRPTRLSLASVCQSLFLVQPRDDVPHRADRTAAGEAPRPAPGRLRLGSASTRKPCTRTLCRPAHAHTRSCIAGRRAPLAPPRPVAAPVDPRVEGFALVGHGLGPVSPAPAPAPQVSGGSEQRPSTTFFGDDASRQVAPPRSPAMVRGTRRPPARVAASPSATSLHSLGAEAFGTDAAPGRRTPLHASPQSSSRAPPVPASPARRAPSAGAMRAEPAAPAPAAAAPPSLVAQRARAQIPIRLRQGPPHPPAPTQQPTPAPPPPPPPEPSNPWGVEPRSVRGAALPLEEALARLAGDPHPSARAAELDDRGRLELQAALEGDGRTFGADDDDEDNVVESPNGEEPQPASDMLLPRARPEPSQSALQETPAPPRVDVVAALRRSLNSGIIHAVGEASERWTESMCSADSRGDQVTGRAAPRCACAWC